MIGVLSVGVFAAWVWTSYVPMREEIGRLKEERDGLRLKETKLRARLDSAQREIMEGARVQQNLSSIERMLVAATSVEEASTAVQEILQGYFERSRFQVRSYQVVPPSSWQDIPMARVRFQLTGSSQALADLLRLLEEEPRLIRVEALSITYRGAQDAPLNIMLQVGSLFVDVKSLQQSLQTTAQGQ